MSEKNPFTCGKSLGVILVLLFLESLFGDTGRGTKGSRKRERDPDSGLQSVRNSILPSLTLKTIRVSRLR